MKKRWTGSKPERCDVCGKTFGLVFVDGRTKGGPWGLMCRQCHNEMGVGLGEGKGQMYSLATLEKLEG